MDRKKILKTSKELFSTFGIMLLLKALQKPDESCVVFSALSTDSGRGDKKLQGAACLPAIMSVTQLFGLLSLCLYQIDLSKETSNCFFPCSAILPAGNKGLRPCTIQCASRAFWSARFHSGYKTKLLAMHFIHDQISLETTNCLLTWAYVL